MQRNHTNRRALLGSLALAATLGAIALPARAQHEPVVVEHVGTATYINGGIGKDEQHYMRTVAKDWPLRMVFSARKDNEFVAGVQLRITDSRGRPYLQLQDVGPMTYAMLPAGTYRLTASVDGKSETREVVLGGKTPRDVAFHWKVGAG